MLHLKHNGILINDNEENADVTELAVCYLNDCVEFDEDVTLRDLFLLIEKNIDIFEWVFRNWIKEHTAYALHSDKDLTNNPLFVDKKLDHVQLTWSVNYDKDNYDIPSIPCFEGHSIALENDQYFEKGQVITLGLDFTPIQNYIDVPFKLNKKIIVFNEDTKESKEYITNSFTLYQIILGVIWEVSFLGNPNDVTARAKCVDDEIQLLRCGVDQLFYIGDTLNALNDLIDDEEEL